MNYALKYFKTYGKLCNMLLIYVSVKLQKTYFLLKIAVLHCYQLAGADSRFGVEISA